ncbi:hypothetical protein QUF55_10260 [Clostridiaceae bacterium HSG29]|nr:hypothetical protein [Clostridiaceae bacterium HSG29]
MLLLIGCSEKENETSALNTGDMEEIVKLLPDYPFTWEYEGSGDYCHTMMIDEIIVLNDSIDYKISGEVISEKNATKFSDYLFDIRYIINEYGLIQEKNEKKMIDSKFNSMYLVKFPIIIGNSWKEKVLDGNGNISYIEATITNIEEINNKKKIYISYDEINSNYIEKRVILEEYGVISFFKELKYKGDIYNYSYELID